METTNIYNCFISSPGDCDEERKICDHVITKINNGLANHLKINFKSLKWEKNVLPDMGKNGQDIIDDSIDKQGYDVFIGIMRYRFGSPTLIAGSGTEHEFNRAIEKKGEGGFPKIIFFFCNETIDPNKLDLQQFEKVKAFKTKLGTNGIYVEYETIENFEALLEQKLEMLAKEISSSFQPLEKVAFVDGITKKLEADLKMSLKSFNEDAPVWINPIISKNRKIPKNPSKNIDHRVEVMEIINKPDNLIIKAPSEFGLSTLAHHLKLEAWRVGKTFIYIDAKETKKHKIVRDLKSVIKDDYGKTPNEVDCIIIDSFQFEEQGSLIMLKNVVEEFSSIPVIVMNTIENDFFLNISEEDEQVKIEREFVSYYLLPLPQSEIRKIVKEYAIARSLQDDDDSILIKVTKDLEALNIHRTPKNCIAILKASSKIGSEYSPINRTKLLDTILLIIFEEYEIPTYKSENPDIKDCTFVLGYLCELLIKRSDYEFSQDYFRTELQKLCDDRFIELNLNYLFQVLYDNSIFAKKGNLFYFKSAYWLFYFSAHRMNLDSIFLQYIFKEKKYVDFPEIMEFYTGIDRNKEDALKVLVQDIRETLSIVNNKVKINGNLNPYKSISWNPNIASLKKEEEKISKNVFSSGLPDAVKDKYNDQQYDQMRPYNQVFNSVMKDYSFLVLMRQTAASSRALRNSDFVSPELKKEVLNEILNAWNEVTKILIILSPILADRGNVMFDGAIFELIEEDFEFPNPTDKRFAVLLSVPKNVVDFFKDDLFSTKMGPLINDKASSETYSLLKHELMLLIVSERPKNWHNVIDAYIVSLDKNSFFLSDIANALRVQLDYHSTEIEDRKKLSVLLRKCNTKHIFKKDNPDMGLIKRLDKLDRGSKF